VSEDGSAISQAVVIVNIRPALCDELAREHAEARTRSVRNLRLLAWSVMKVRRIWGEESMGGYLPHINRLFVVFTHCIRSCSRSTTDSQLHAMISIVRLARRCVLGSDVTGACEVVSVTSPSPCARMPHHPLAEIVAWGGSLQGSGRDGRNACFG
jgi:hypothetical protein